MSKPASTSDFKDSAAKAGVPKKAIFMVQR
jgi:hypothetical protein